MTHWTIYLNSGLLKKEEWEKEEKVLLSTKATLWREGTTAMSYASFQQCPAVFVTIYWGCTNSHLILSNTGIAWQGCGMAAGRWRAVAAGHGPGGAASACVAEPEPTRVRLRWGWSWSRLPYFSCTMLFNIENNDLQVGKFKVCYFSKIIVCMLFFNTWLFCQLC